MKITVHIMASVLAVWLVGCRTQPAASSRVTIYEYPAQVLAMPSCAAKVEEITPCYACLTAEDGTLLYVGGPTGSWEVVGFVQTLQKGKTYPLPDAFIEYQKKQTNGPNKADTGGGK